MKKVVTCDVCGKEMPAEEAIWDVGYEQDLCAEHARMREIADLERDINEKRKWLEATHLADLAKKEERLRELRGEV